MTLNVSMFSHTYTKLLQQWIPEFGAATGAKVNFDTPGFPVYNQHADLELSTHGAAFDVVNVTFIYSSRWINAGWLTPLDEFIRNPSLTPSEWDLDDFNGTACIGAPPDLSVIDKYKEAGFRTLAINIEVWNEHFFRAYCPGKELECGGQKHWVEALEYAVGVFGRGRVRSNMVGGLESKASTLEGIETLTSRGVLAISPAWVPNPGSALEGHRTPEPEWHIAVARKTYQLYRNVGFTFEQLYDATAVPQTLIHDLFRIEEGRLAVFARQQVEPALAD